VKTHKGPVQPLKGWTGPLVKDVANRFSLRKCFYLSREKAASP
jgi:hypothetical protein